MFLQTNQCNCIQTTLDLFLLIEADIQKMLRVNLKNFVPG